jgi:CRP/FNR family cyclic AMP-dependent transcriptional regulator
MAAHAKRGKEESFDPHVFLSSNGLTGNLKEYPPNYVIFAQDELCDALFYIQQGKVKLTVVSEQGKEAIIAMLGTGDFLAESSLLGCPKHLASAITLMSSAVVKIEKREMVATLKDEPTFSRLFISYLLSRIARVQSDLIDQLFNNSEKRLARTLILLSGLGSHGGSSRVVPNVTQDTLAKILGVSRERVNVLMNKFKKLGFIDYSGGLKVHDSLFRVFLNE